ncbi:enoyl-CoA hydratase/isomerase family protein [Mycolicibacterium baixiangningiae]|uniref:enoyl-CoA hydratase/isomerase family protein n=1 Tax=Mycolicibacterium baixiangningiae TaxID=2761578 RepID=UPI0018D015B0|nr:enoyl-CoA hydratase/isomerase family protein [Mycolicibacterium baixiangningiae]
MTRPSPVQIPGATCVDDSGVLIVTLDRPPANALNRSLVVGLRAFFAELASHEAPAPVVLTGAGARFFTAGGDIKELEGTGPEEIEGRMRDFHALLVAMDRFPRPLIAAVNGHCVGGGMELALFADTILATPNATFGFPEINHGLLPADKGLQRAALLLGAQAVRRMVLSGELFPADEAVRIGLVERLETPATLLPAAIHAAREAGAKAPVLYRALKRSVNNPSDERDEHSLANTIAAAADYFEDPVAAGLRAGWNRDKASIAATR